MKILKGLFFLYLMAFSGYIFGQKLEITGQVTDTEGSPLVDVNVQIEKNGRGTTTDTNGRFVIHAEKGAVLVFSFIGMKTETRKVEGMPNNTVDVVLIHESEDLDEVTVTFKKPLIEADKGRTIFNVQNSALTSGQTVFDLLRRLPGVSIGQNDEILFRGASGINVMIDGKMNYLSGNQLVNYLKGMSAEELNRIELITAPPAEFDASGNSGVINIVPKKNLRNGYAVDLLSSISKGKYWMTNQNIAASYRAENWSVNGMFDFKTPHSYSQNSSGNTINDNGNILLLRRENEPSFKINYYTWRIGADWQFLPKHKIGVNYHGYLDDFKSYNRSTVRRFQEGNNLHSFIRSENNIVEPYHYDAFNLNYSYEIDSMGKRISADAHYISYRNFSDGRLTTRSFDANGTFEREDVLLTHQPGFVKIKSSQVDADLPFKTFSLKTGLKYAEAENDNQSGFDSLRMDGDFVEAEGMGNHFRYNERIAAAYVSGQKKFNKTNIEAGVRVEYTNADGHTVKQGVVNKWEYTKLFPSVSVEHLIDDDNKVDLSWSRRINRPYYAALNPVRWYVDQYYYASGNPELVPELAWVYSATYSLKNKYIFTASYNHSVNYMNRRLTIDDNGITVRSMMDNFGDRHRFDLTSSIPFRPYSFWDVQFFSDVSYTIYPISLRAGEKDLSKWAISASLQQDFSLPKDYKVSLSTSWLSSELRGIYTTKPTGFVDFGIRKSFLDGRFDTQLTVSDVFNTNRYKAFSQTDVVDYFYNDKPFSRVFGISLRYHIGGELIKASGKKTEEQQRL